METASQMLITPPFPNHEPQRPSRKFAVLVARHLNRPIPAIILLAYLYQQPPHRHLTRFVYAGVSPLRDTVSKGDIWMLFRLGLRSSDMEDSPRVQRKNLHRCDTPALCKSLRCQVERNVRRSLAAVLLRWSPPRRLMLQEKGFKARILRDVLQVLRKRDMLVPNPVLALDHANLLRELTVMSTRRVLLIQRKAAKFRHPRQAIKSLRPKLKKRNKRFYQVNVLSIMPTRQATLSQYEAAGL